MNMPARNPLETLVIAELAELRKREVALQSHLNTEAGLDQSQDTAEFQRELAQLRNHTDRLGRMMDAMSSFFSTGINETLLPAPAL